MSPRGLLCAAIGPLFIGAGTLHFTNTGAYVAIMPPYLPAHRELVLASGAAEIAGGLGILLPRTRRLSGWGLIALLVAVFPANIQMAVHPEQVRGLSIPRALLWLRLPLQGVLIAWVRAAMRVPEA